VFFEGNMQKNGELFQKYCAHIGGRVTVISGENGKNCLCAHLCHGQKCEERNFNTACAPKNVRGIDINEN
jgi:putative hemolysin